jgi:hypothetical protein
MNLFNTPTMRALSWKEPFASLMLEGKIETRVWPTNYRGPVLICASKAPYNYNQLKGICGYGEQLTRVCTFLDRNISNEIPLHHGHAIAVGNLVNCRLMKKEDEKLCFVEYREPWIEVRKNKKTGKEREVLMKLYCHIYEDVKPIIPIPWEGVQGWKSLDEEFIKSIKLINK